MMKIKSFEMNMIIIKMLTSNRIESNINSRKDM